MTNIINMYFNYIKKMQYNTSRWEEKYDYCGKSGCGKSTLSNQIIELTNNKAIHLDIDKVEHNVLLLPEVQKELINSFSKSVVKEYQFVSSSIVKEVLNLDKDISRYVDPIVRERMLVKKRSLIR